MTARRWMIIAACCAAPTAGPPVAADGPGEIAPDGYGVSRWALSATLAVEDSDTLLVDVGVDTWVVPGAGEAARRLHPTWITVRSVDGRGLVEEARFQREGWLTSTGRDSVRVGSISLTALTGGARWRLEVSHDEHTLALDVEASMPDVSLDGRRIYSDVRVEGALAGERRARAVTGKGRVDTSREPLGAFGDRAGTDVLQFETDDGGRVLIARERDQRFGRASRVRGVYAGSKGVALDLNALNVSFYPVGAARWTSPVSGVDYPLRWRLHIPALGIRCDVEPLADEREIDGRDAWGATLWRGPVRVFGWRDETPLDARGSLELSGYGGPMPPRALVAEREPS